MSSSLRRLYEDLRSVNVGIVYPPGEDRDIVVRQLKRIGCHLNIYWPFPAEPPKDVEVIFFQVAQELEGNSRWTVTATDATLIALSDYESPTTLKLLINTNAHGVIVRPFRSSGILSTLVLARSEKNFQLRQEKKIRKLEGTIKSRRQIEKAIRIVAERRDLNDTEAYEHLRRQATKLRISVAEVAIMLIDATDAMEKTGL
jgi:AmiR/NasT family two-component response regulator|tara:strand:- start:6044 stop:6646 length:603 start_codon:yes stop_codon:yes gene_type:complete